MKTESKLIILIVIVFFLMAFGMSYVLNFETFNEPTIPIDEVDIITQDSIKLNPIDTSADPNLLGSTGSGTK
jgi:hypothetical protein